MPIDRYSMKIKFLFPCGMQYVLGSLDYSTLSCIWNRVWIVPIKRNTNGACGYVNDFVNMVRNTASAVCVACAAVPCTHAQCMWLESL